MTDKLEGVPVTISEKEFILGPLSRKEYVSLVPAYYTRTDTASFIVQVIDAGIRVIHASLSRNYNLSICQVRALLDFDTPESIRDTMNKAYAELECARMHSVTEAIRNAQAITKAIHKAQAITETIKNISNIR